MKPWRSTSSPAKETKKRSQAGAIIKFGLTWWIRWERCSPAGAICIVSMRLVAQKNGFREKRTGGLLRGSRFPWAGFKPSRYGSRGVRFIWP
jgi:hypothetical protein